MGGAAVKKRSPPPFGKKDRCERNPSGESFTFNHCIFRTFMKVLKMRGSERNLFCQKKAPPFFDKLRGDPGLLSGASSFMQLRVRRKPSQPVGGTVWFRLTFQRALRFRVTVMGIITTVKEAARTQTMMLLVSPVLGASGLPGSSGLPGFTGSGFSGWATPS